MSMNETNLDPVEFDPFAGPELSCVAPAIEPQSEIWISCLMGGDDANRCYNESVSLCLTGPFDKHSMELALKDVINRHEGLRSAFSADGKQFLVFKELPLHLTFEDLSSQHENQQKQYIADFAKRDAETSFDLLQGPLFRPALFKLSDQRHYLTLSAHHIVCDGWSLGILMQDISKLYSAYVKKQIPALPPALRFSEFAVEQNNFSRTEEYKKIEQYWVDQYKDEAPILNLPTDFPRPAERTYKSHRDDFVLDADLVASVKKMGASAGCSFVTTLIASYEIFLHRLTGQKDIVLGLPAAGQSVTNHYALIGHCVNLLPLRSNLEEEETFIDYLKQRKKKILDDYDHQQFTFGSLLKKINLTRDSSRVPLVPAVLNIDTGMDDGVAFEGLKHELVYNPREYESFEIFLNVTSSAKALVLEWSYNTQLFKSATIKNMMEEFEFLLRELIRNPAQRVKDIRSKGSETIKDKLKEWNNTVSVYPKNSSVHSLIDERVAEFPEKIALRFEGVTATFKEFNETANQLAKLLLEEHVQKGDVIGVAIDRSLEMVIALLAILKSGAAYVPLDPEYPEERIAFMLEDSSAKILLTSKKYAGHFQSGAKEIVIEDAWKKLPQFSKEAPAVGVNGTDLAYILYTSGSTGKPKGVMVDHRNLVNLLYSMVKMPGISADDKLLAVTTISFDIAGLELFLPPITGAELVMAGADATKDGRMLLKLVKDEKISIMQATPSTYKIMLDAGWKEKFNLKILCCGEPMSNDLAGKLISRCASLYNMYGPTETTIYSSGTRIYSGDELITIGKPIANTQIYILDDRLRLLPEGSVGEIYLGGDGVARGYLNRPALNAEKFVDDPFSSQPGAKMYRTGDLGRFMPDGNIHCLGRIDQQVKIRGYRIELGEIEHKLNKLEDIKEAVVIAREDKPGNQRLVAYVLPEKSIANGNGHLNNGKDNATKQIQGWRQKLKSALPAFMVPNDFIVVQQFPLTPNGKIDKKALPKPEPGLEHRGKKISPRTRNEEIVASIWTELLGVNDLSIDDDFFELGGHSVIAAQVMTRLEKETGVSMPLTTLFKSPVLEQLALLIDKDKINGTHSLADDKIMLAETEPDKIFIPAIDAQTEIWLACVLGGEDASRAYNISISEKLYGKLDMAAMKLALQDLINRHESLRTTFDGENEKACIHKVWPLTLYTEDISSLHAAQQQIFIDGFSKQNAETTFDLKNGPLHRIALFRLSEEAYHFTLAIHHIICDGWSLGVLMKELSELYSAHAKNESPDLPAAPKFSDFAIKQIEFSKSGDYKKTEQYWLDQFKDAVPVLELPVDYSRPPTRTYKSHRDDYELDSKIISDFKKISVAAGCSMAIAMRAAFEIFLYKLAEQNDLVLGLSVSGQLATGNFNLVGHCANVLPVRATLKKDLSFTEYLQERKLAILDAYDHQRVSFGSLLKKLNVARDKSRVPLVSAVFNIEMISDDDGVDFYGLKHEMIFNPREYETFDLFLNTGGTEMTPTLQWSYNTQLFKSASIRNMMYAFASLLKEISERPDHKTSDLLMFVQHQLIEQSLENKNKIPEKKYRELPELDIESKTVIDLFSEQVALTPDKMAVTFEEKALSYRELNEVSNQLANYLHERGVKTETLVPICITRSLEMIIGILGIMKAGGAYVPIDPDYPDDRINYMLDDIEGNIVLSNSACKARIPAIKNIIELDGDWKKISKSSKENISLMPKPHDLAYVIYTSGSTGKPKGVMNEHVGLLNRLIWAQNYFKLTHDDAVLQKTTFCFDVSVWELVWPLLVGTKLVFAKPGGHKDGDYLKSIIEKEQITTIHFVPSMLDLFLFDLEAKQSTSLKKVLCSGEALKSAQVKLFQEKLPGVELHNLYGPTEAAIDVTCWSLENNVKDLQIIPIGKPVLNTQIYILDERNKALSAGQMGELYIGGIQVARGYLHRPELTAQRFVADPFSMIPGARMYKTGDLAKWLPDGNIDYLGRTDDQVKIRGFRIELGEIENVLQQFPGVRNCVVTAPEDDHGEKRLVGYIAIDGAINKKAMIGFLESKLPEYMVPRILMQVGDIPLTSNGKADKKALPKPDFSSPVEISEYIPPRTEGQKIIASIWSEALGLKQVSIVDDFFELGGHSLVAIKVMKLLEQKTGQRLPITALFEAPSVEKLSLLLDIDKKNLLWNSLVLIKPGGNKPPLYFIHGSGLTVMVFNDVAKRMDPDQPVYGLQARGLNGEDPFDTMEDIASYYISEIVAQNPNGPYCLAGYSFGGIVAFEMAKQFIKMGKEVKMLALFDTHIANEDYFLSSASKMKRKILRQLPKMAFILTSLAKHPKATIRYQVDFFQSKVRKILEKIGLMKPRESAEQSFSVYADMINEKHDYAYMNYKMTPYDGVLDLFRVRTRLYYLDDPEYLGWKSYSKKIIIHEIDGDHKTFLIPPNDEGLAIKLKDTLNERIGFKK
ncbi:MAG TPA: amino acid adenylation domain-containing protein [Puia sp.]|nr:amino acid adenylation domain-containing protein [Puia sp.]